MGKKAKNVTYVPSKLDKSAIATSIDVKDDELGLREFVFDFLHDAPAPEPWVEQVDKKKRVFFWNPASRASSWSHPLDASFRILVHVFRETFRGTEVLDDAEEQDHFEQAVGEELRRSHEELEEDCGKWRYTHSSTGVKYYYHEETKDTRWDDPRDELLAHLKFQGQVLESLLNPEYRAELREIDPSLRKIPKRIPTPEPEPVIPEPEPVVIPEPIVVPTPEPEPVVVYEEPPPVEVPKTELLVPEFMDADAFARTGLGLLEDEELLLELLRPVLFLPLPYPWTAKFDGRDRVYFYHTGFGESSWSHPLQGLFVDLLALLRQYRPYFQAPDEMCAALLQALREHVDAAKKKFGTWDGPWHDPAVGRLFYSDGADRCRWDDLKQSVGAEVQAVVSAFRLLWESLIDRPFDELLQLPAVALAAADEQSALALLNEDAAVQEQCHNAAQAVLGRPAMPSFQQRNVQPYVAGCLAMVTSLALVNVADTKLRQAASLTEERDNLLAEVQRPYVAAELSPTRLGPLDDIAESEDAGDTSLEVEASATLGSPGSSPAKSRSGLAAVGESDEEQEAPIEEPVEEEPVVEARDPDYDSWDDRDLGDLSSLSDIEDKEALEEIDWLAESGVQRVPKPDETVAEVPDTAVGEEWSWRDFVVATFVKPLLTDLEATVLKNIVRIHNAPRSGQYDEDLSALAQSHFASLQPSMLQTPVPEPVEDLQMTITGDESLVESPHGTLKPLVPATKPEMAQFYKDRFDKEVVQSFMDDLASGTRRAAEILQRPQTPKTLDLSLPKLSGMERQQTDAEREGELSLSGDPEIPEKGRIARPSTPEGARPKDLFPYYLKEKARKKYELGAYRPRATSADWKNPYSNDKYGPSLMSRPGHDRPSSGQKQKRVFAEPVPLATFEQQDAVRQVFDRWAAQQGGVEELFEAMDQDRKGYLTLKVFDQRLKELGFPGERDVLCAQLDRNHNGVLVLEHFTGKQPLRQDGEDGISLLEREVVPAVKAEQESTGPLMRSATSNFQDDEDEDEHDPVEEALAVREVAAEIWDEAFAEFLEQTVKAALGHFAHTALINGLQPPKPLPDLEFLRKYAARREAERRAHEAELRKLEADKLRLDAQLQRMTSKEKLEWVRITQESMLANAPPMTPPEEAPSSVRSGSDYSVPLADLLFNSVSVREGTEAYEPPESQRDAWEEPDRDYYREYREMVRKEKERKRREKHSVNRAIYEIRRTPMYRLYAPEFRKKVLPSFALRPPPAPGLKDTRPDDYFRDLPPLKGPKKGGAAPPPPPQAPPPQDLRPVTPSDLDATVPPSFLQRLQPRPQAPKRKKERKLKPLQPHQREGTRVGTLALQPDMSRLAVLHQLSTLLPALAVLPVVAPAQMDVPKDLDELSLEELAARATWGQAVRA